ncbi:nucleoside recognition protein, partial [Bacteroidales bacterium OttesenSCG-928-K03]|nr:nucleoside recognition protein [Bacteroidales bacterium OttesenSCG-928-K03]
MNNNWQRTLDATKRVLPSALKTAWWIIKITVIVSFSILILKYFGVIDWISVFLSPIFSYIGLPGEAALAYVSGYFVNVYSGIAAMVTLDMDVRAITILSAMILCSHNMITETAVQKKTGSSAIRMVVIRTLSAIILGFVLNLIMPGKTDVSNVQTSIAITESLIFKDMFLSWLRTTFFLVLKMTGLIFGLSILQSILNEFGIIKILSKGLKPVMMFFGLPTNTAFLWIVANTLGLAYGAAVMIEETQNGNVSIKDADLLNHHISISHSNLEDLLLLASVGGMVWWLLLSRWAMSFVIVWERRLE